MSKMGLQDPFGYLRHKLWPKERPGVKLWIWLLTMKSQESSWFCCKWCGTYCWKAIKEGYNFSLDLTLIEGLHVKLWASKVAKIPILGILRLQLGSPKTKCIWVLALWPSIENTIRRKVVASPKSKHGESCESMFTCGLSMH